jgi:hypothetical protein
MQRDSKRAHREAPHRDVYVMSPQRSSGACTQFVASSLQEYTILLCIGVSDMATPSSNATTVAGTADEHHCS